MIIMTMIMMMAGGGGRCGEPGGEIITIIVIIEPGAGAKPGEGGENPEEKSAMASHRSYFNNLISRAGGIPE